MVCHTLTINNKLLLWHIYTVETVIYGIMKMKIKQDIYMINKKSLGLNFHSQYMYIKNHIANRSFA